MSGDDNDDDDPRTTQLVYVASAHAVQHEMSEIVKSVQELSKERRDEMQAHAQRIIRDLNASGFHIGARICMLAHVFSTIAIVMKEGNGMPFSISASVFATIISNMADTEEAVRAAKNSPPPGSPVN